MQSNYVLLWKKWRQKCFSISPIHITSMFCVNTDGNFSYVKLMPYSGQNEWNRQSPFYQLHTHMAIECCDNLKTNIPCFVSMISFVALVALFITGGILYHQERRKEINYDNDMCLVLTHGYRNCACQGKYSAYPWFSATWDVRLNKMVSINATAESILKYRSINEALARTKEYPVRKCKYCGGQ